MTLQQTITHFKKLAERNQRLYRRVSENMFQIAKRINNKRRKK